MQMISVQELLRQSHGASSTGDQTSGSNHEQMGDTAAKAAPQRLKQESQKLNSRGRVALEPKPGESLNAAPPNSAQVDTAQVNTTQVNTTQAPVDDSATVSRKRRQWFRRAKSHQPIGRRGLQQRRLLGLLCLGGGYVCVGTALQSFGVPPVVWLLIGGVSSLWGVERARQWHSLIPAMVAALALVSVLLPLWVLGLLSIPIVGFFGCVLLMKEQTLETALVSSLFVYSLSAIAASVGAIGLGLLGGDVQVMLLRVLQITAGFVLLSLFTGLHRRRFYGLKGLSLARRFVFKSGLFSGLAALGLAAGFGLNLVNWPMVMATTSQWLQ